MEELALYKIFIKGRVQGVGFRYYAAEEAKSRGINGYVKNLPDGRVYIEAEGKIEELKSFLEWCRKGPRFALVLSVNEEKYAPVHYSDFAIK